MKQYIQSVSAIILLSAFLTGCVTTKPAGNDAKTRGYTSLDYIYYRNNPPVPAATSLELQGAAQRLRSMPTGERDFLTRLYGDDFELIAYALRDTDNDGLTDYRINEDSRFIENDTDVDGDGVFNARDADPYDSGITGEDANGNGVPDHVDWEFMDNRSYANLQARMLRDFDIIMVERNSHFTEKLAQANYDAMHHVIRPVLERLQGLYPGTSPALKTMASENIANHSEKKQRKVGVPLWAAL